MSATKISKANKASKPADEAGGPTEKVVGQRNLFSPFEVFFAPSVQQGERSYREPLALVPSFAEKGWDGRMEVADFMPATKAQQEEGRAWLASHIAWLRTQETVKLFTRLSAKEVDKATGEAKEIWETTTGDIIADAIEARYLPRMTFAYVANSGQHRVQQLLVSLYAYEEFGRVMEKDHSIGHFVIDAMYDAYASPLEALTARVTDNVQRGKEEYTPENIVGICVKALDLGASAAQISRMMGWQPGKKQEYVDRAQLCRAYPELSILDRLHIDPRTGQYPEHCIDPKTGRRKVIRTADGKNPYLQADQKSLAVPTPYVKYGYIPYQRIPATFCRAVLGTAREGSADGTVKKVYEDNGKVYVAERLTETSLAEKCIEAALGADPKPKVMSRDPILDLATLVKNDEFLSGLLTAIANNDSKGATLLVSNYVATHAAAWQAKAQAQS